MECALRRQREDYLGSVGRTMAVLATALLVSTVAHAQEYDAARRAYFDAVADFFKMPLGEVVILGDWELADDEIPAVLFVARQAGVSPEALVALRRSGRSWTALIQRYGIGAPSLHVPIRDQAPAGALAAAYDQYRATPVAEWSAIRLTDNDVIALVNVRVIAQTLDLSAEAVVRETASITSYVELFAQLSR